MLIDINASFGGREALQRFTVESLEHELNRTPYSLAFVSANEGEFDPRTANDDILERCARHDRWLPTATLHPGDTFSWQDELRRAQAIGIKLFRINPVASGWAADSILMDLLVDRLAGTGAALIVGSAPAGLPSRIAGKTALAGVPVIFTEARYFPLTELIPLAQHYQDIYIETSRLTSPGGIALCVGEIGAHRLLYGSGAPRYPAGVAWRMLQWAEISDAQRTAIAWRNASTLLGLDPPPLFRPPSGVKSASGQVTIISAVKAESDPESNDAERGTISVARRGTPHETQLRQKLQQTERKTMTGLRALGPSEPANSGPAFPPAVDVHLHDKFAGAPFPRFSPADYDAELARNRILAGVSSSATAIFHDLRKGNDQQEAVLREVPRLRGYVVVDPRYLDDSLVELDRLSDSDRWVGVKVHCAHARTLTGSPAMANLMAAVAERERPILVHPLGADWPEALSVLARRHPKLPIVAAHGGYGDAPHPTHDAVLRLAGFPNVVVEFCSTYLAPGAIRRGIRSLGVERVLFGSDFPLISLEYMRVAYNDAELTGEEEEAIFIKNALRLFPSLGALVEEGCPTNQA